MAIYSASEFEVVMATVIAKTERLLDEKPRNEALLQAKRALGALEVAVKRGNKLSALELKALTAAVETIDRLGKGDPDLGDRLYDFIDYIEDELAESSAK